MDFEEIERIKKENEKLKAIVECVDKLKQFNEDIENYALVDYKEVDKIVCENIQLKQKIVEKDKAIESWETMYKSVMQTCHNDKEEIERLREQIALTEKALELACERVKYFEEMQGKEMGFSEFFGYDSDYDLKAIIEQYKEQAKEMMKSE